MMGRAWLGVGAILALGITALCLIHWNDQRLSRRSEFCGAAGDHLTSEGSCWNEKEPNATWGLVRGFCRLDQLSERGACEVTEFVPDLPKRMFFRDPSLDTIIISDETASPALLTYTPTGDVHINRDDGLKCLYYDGHPVAFLVYKNGSRVRVPCVEVP